MYTHAHVPNICKLSQTVPDMIISATLISTGQLSSIQVGKGRQQYRHMYV